MEYSNFSYRHNIIDALNQELELARSYYHWACTLPNYNTEAVDRYKDARARLDKVNRMIAAATGGSND